ncbi:MAG: hypothetical protein J6Y94_03625 [Bacteriovoracaceae bacterium]|nr:hypothetical protein [Bacteriovoracaceae bacterium]
MRDDAPKFVKFLLRFIPSPRFFPLLTFPLLIMLGAWDASAALDPEARITRLRIEDAGEVTFDYPYHWDAESPLLVAPGNVVSLTLDVVEYNANSVYQVQNVGVPIEKFTVAIAYTNTRGQRSYIKVVNPILGLSWQDVDWGNGDWQRSLVWEVPEDFLGDGFILFSYQKFQSKVAIENIADVTIDNTQDKKLEALVPVESNEDASEVQVVAYYPDILETTDGEWIYLYGIRYWRPLHLPVAWRPYTHGRWYRGVYGITWQAYSPWEEYVDHYGTWYYHQRYGWIVQIGTVWRPHRVTFYYNSDQHYVAWRPFLSYGLSIQARAYAPYHRSVELGLVDYWAETPATSLAIDYVVVPSNKFALSITAGIGSLDISATIISSPVRRNVILPPPPLRPRPIVAHAPPPRHGPGLAPSTGPKHAPAPVIRHPEPAVGPAAHHHPPANKVAPPKSQSPRTPPKNVIPRGNQPSKPHQKPVERLNPNPKISPNPQRPNSAPQARKSTPTAPSVKAPGKPLNNKAPQPNGGQRPKQIAQNNSSPSNAGTVRPNRNVQPNTSVQRPTQAPQQNRTSPSASSSTSRNNLGTNNGQRPMQLQGRSSNQNRSPSAAQGGRSSGKAAAAPRSGGHSGGGGGRGGHR